MPNVYKLKTCSACATEHRKRGPYCSRSCGNSRDIPTDVRSERMKKHHASNSDVALKQKWIISQQGSNPGIKEQELDDHYVVPPEDPGFGGYEIDTDGDLWR